MRRILISGWGVSPSAMQGLARAEDACVRWNDPIEFDEPVVLVGWSLGGVVASELARESAVKGLVTLCTPGHFQSQVNMRLFARLKRNLAKDPQSTLGGFYDWLLPEADRQWMEPIELNSGLDRLCESHCASQWSALGVPHLNLVADQDPLFQADSAVSPSINVRGDHQLPYREVAAVRALVDEFTDAL
jgi:esterase/lipase